MTRITFSLFVFVVATFIFAVSVSAQQRYSLVQRDYDDYAKLFKVGKEPNLSHGKDGNLAWRNRARQNGWKDFADGTESREPMLAAQTLRGIYQTSFVDHELTSQINNLILSKGALSAALAESMILAQIDSYLQTADNARLDAVRAAGARDPFRTDEEARKLEDLGRDIDKMVRQKLVSPSTIMRGYESEIRSVQNLFLGETGWVATYRRMREKFDVLNDLEKSFEFGLNEDDPRWNDAVERMKEKPSVIREAKARAEKVVMGSAARTVTGGGGTGYGTVYPDPSGYDYQSSGSNSYPSVSPVPSGGSGGMVMPVPQQGYNQSYSPPQVVFDEKELKTVEESFLEELAEEASDKLKERAARHSAYKGVVGSYQSSEYHLVTLREIYSYYSKAAQSDPIAQVHLALFLRYLGDFLPELSEEEKSPSRIEGLLRAAEQSDIAKAQVAEIRKQLVAEGDFEKKRKRDEAFQAKYARLLRLEDEKLDMIDEVLVRISQRQGAGGGGGARGAPAGAGGPGGMPMVPGGGGGRGRLGGGGAYQPYQPY